MKNAVALFTIVLALGLNASAYTIAQVSHVWTAQAASIDRIITIDNLGVVSMIKGNPNATPVVLATLSSVNLANLKSNIANLDTSRKLPITNCAESTFQISKDGQNFTTISYSDASGMAPNCNQYMESALGTGISDLLQGFLMSSP